MKLIYILIGLAVLLAGVLGSLAWRAHLSRTQAPALGLLEGRLRPCGVQPNSVCSEDPRPDRAVPPYSFTRDGAEAMARMQRILREVPGTRVVESAPAYLRAECRSGLFGFVDDLEFRLDEGAKVIHVRSASRQGYSDMGVNRRRVEALRAAF